MTSSATAAKIEAAAPSSVKLPRADRDISR
jgi:hypothetical protein